MSNTFIEPQYAEQSFAENFDLEHPQTAAGSYAKLMHQHTMQQLEAAARSASRRGSSAPSHQGSLSSESSLESESSDL